MPHAHTRRSKWLSSSDRVGSRAKGELASWTQSKKDSGEDEILYGASKIANHPRSTWNGNEGQSRHSHRETCASVPVARSFERLRATCQCVLWRDSGASTCSSCIPPASLRETSSPCTPFHGAGAERYRRMEVLTQALVFLKTCVVGSEQLPLPPPCPAERAAHLHRKQGPWLSTNERQLPKSRLCPVFCLHSPAQRV
jgi:hypothetical protein